VLPVNILKDAIKSTQLGIYEKKELLTGLKFSYLAGKTKPTKIMDLALTMRNTSDKAIIEALSGRISAIYDVYARDFDKEDFLFYSKQTALPMLEKIGYEFNLNESIIESKSRNFLFNILKDDEEVRNEVINLAKQYLNKAGTLSWKHYNYLTYLFYYQGTPDLYNMIINRIEKTTNPTERRVLLFSIGLFSDSSLVKRNLKYTLSENLQASEPYFIILGIQKMYKRVLYNKENILPWFKEHYSFFEENVSYLDYWTPYLIHDYDDLTLFNKLFPNKERSKTLAKEIMKKTEELKRAKKLRELYAGDVSEYFKKYSKELY